MAAVEIIIVERRGDRLAGVVGDEGGGMRMLLLRVVVVGGVVRRPPSPWSLYFICSPSGGTIREIGLSVHHRAR